VFRSKSRSVVYPHAEHARLSAAIAAAWGNESVTRPALPFESFVRGVELHDRGYGVLDNDGLGEIPQERWLKIMRRGLEAQDEDAVVDLVVVMHIRRLVANSDASLGAELDAAYAARLEVAGVSEQDAAAADVVTNLCDRLSFSFCFEEAGAGTVGSFVYSIGSDGVAAVSPWPLGVQRLTETVIGYRADGYPEQLEPVERVFCLRPA
jgi:hypothetical protein